MPSACPLTIRFSGQTTFETAGTSLARLWFPSGHRVSDVRLGNLSWRPPRHDRGVAATYVVRIAWFSDPPRKPENRFRHFGENSPSLQLAKAVSATEARNLICRQLCTGGLVLATVVDRRPPIEWPTGPVDDDQVARRSNVPAMSRARVVSRSVAKSKRSSAKAGSAWQALTALTEECAYIHSAPVVTRVSGHTLRESSPSSVDTMHARLEAYAAAELDEVVLVPATAGDPGGEHTLTALASFR
jgi:hypothetical protein